MHGLETIKGMNAAAASQQASDRAILKRRVMIDHYKALAISLRGVMDERLGGRVDTRVSTTFAILVDALRAADPTFDIDRFVADFKAAGKQV